MIAYALLTGALGLAVLGEVERARDPSILAPDAIWARRLFRLYSNVDLACSAQYGVATLTIRNAGRYPVRVAAVAQLKGSSWSNNPIDVRPFSLGWQEETARELTISPHGVASLLLAKVERTPQPDANPDDWYTLSFWECGKDDPFATQLWQRQKELRMAIGVELHCVPPVRDEPIGVTFDVVLVPPTANLEVQQIGDWKT